MREVKLKDLRVRRPSPDGKFIIDHVSFADLVAALLNETSAKKEWRCSLTRITDQGEVLGVLPGSATWWKCFEGYELHNGCGWVLVVPLEDE